MSTTSFIPSTVTSWNNLDYVIKSPAYYGEGSRKLSILYARLRHQCSSLNSDLFRIHITNDSKWQCGSRFEDSVHYIMECPLHQDGRDCLSRNQRETHKHIETLLFGNDEIDINENCMLFAKVRADIWYFDSHGILIPGSIFIHGILSTLIENQPPCMEIEPPRYFDPPHLLSTDRQGEQNTMDRWVKNTMDSSRNMERGSTYHG